MGTPPGATPPTTTPPTARPPVTTPPTAAPPTAPGAWTAHIKSGATFWIAFNGVVKAGAWGTVKTDGVYKFQWNARSGFTATGFNLGSRGVGSWTYKNADPDKGQVSLWGGVYSFDQDGKVRRNGTVVGTLSKTAPAEASPTSQGPPTSSGQKAVAPPPKAPYGFFERDGIVYFSNGNNAFCAFGDWKRLKNERAGYVSRTPTYNAFPSGMANHGDCSGGYLKKNPPAPSRGRPSPGVGG